MQRQWRFSQHFLIEYLSFSSKFSLVSAKNGKKGVKSWKKVFRLIDITIDIIFFSINLEDYFDRLILVMSMTVQAVTIGGNRVPGLIPMAIPTTGCHLQLSHMPITAIEPYLVFKDLLRKLIWRHLNGTQD